MILPPKHPIEGKYSYFDMLCADAQKYIPHIPLRFDGYEDLLDKYMALSDLDSNANFEMSKEFQAWFDYIAGLANRIQNAFLDAETDKLQVFSQKSLDSSGDRKANTEPDVIIARKKRNALKSLYDALVARQDFCEKAFYQCKYNCMESVERSGGNNARRRTEY